MTKVLITGGAGFIGSNLTRHLVEQGHVVTVLDNLSPQVHGKDPNASPLLKAVESIAEVVVGAITDRRAVRQVLRGQDVVVHLAAETGTGQSMYEIARYSDVNIGGTALLLDELATDSERSVRKVVIASSRSIYGEGRYWSEELGYVYPGSRTEPDLLAGRFEPTYDGDKSGLRMAPTTEDSRVHPSSVYGITKQTQEQLVMTVCPTLGIAPVGLRYQNVYGPGQSLTNPYTGILSIFSTLIRQGRAINVFEDGLESRDFVYIDDVVRATSMAALDEGANGQVFNVGSGIATSVNEVVEALQDAYERSVPVTVSGNFRLGDIRHNVADIQKISTMLGFAPSVSFREGVQKFAEWVETQDLEDGGYEESLSEMRERNLLK